MGWLAAEDGTEGGEPVTVEFFRQQMDRLRGLRFVPSDLDTHWEALRDLPDAVLEAAVTRAQRTRVEFPTPVELRMDADQVAPHVRHVEPLPDQGVDLPEPVQLGTLPTGRPLPPATRLWRYYCEVCNDTGTQALWCGKRPTVGGHVRQPWMPVEECGAFNCRKLKHGDTAYGHEWFRRCVCADSNPAVLRSREQHAKYAPAPHKGAA